LQKTHWYLESADRHSYQRHPHRGSRDTATRGDSTPAVASTPPGPPSRPAPGPARR